MTDAKKTVSHCWVAVVTNSVNRSVGLSALIRTTARCSLQVVREYY